MLKSFSICSLTLILISLFLTTSMMQQQQQQQHDAIGLSQKTPFTLVHANTNDLLTQKKKTDIKTQNSSFSITAQKEEAASAVKNFQEAFCGVNTTPNSNVYIT